MTCRLKFQLIASTIVLKQSVLQSTCAASEHTHFLHWIRDHGGTHPLVEPKEFEGFGRGLLTTQEVHHGDLIMDIPIDLIICRETLATSKDPHIRKLSQSISDETDLIAVVLAREYLKGGALRLCHAHQQLKMYIRRRIVLEAISSCAPIVRPAAQLVSCSGVAGTSASINGSALKSGDTFLLAYHE